MKELFACTFQGLVFPSYNFIRAIYKCVGDEVPKYADNVLDFTEREEGAIRLYPCFRAHGIYHLPVCMCEDMFFTGHSQKTETTRAPSPEHSGGAEEVAKGPSAYNKSFSLLVRQDKTPFRFRYNLKTKNIFQEFQVLK